MAKVQLTSQLEAQLTGTPFPPLLLQQQFSKWKNGDEYGSYLFSRDKTDPQTKLSHAHMVPVNDLQALAAWDEHWKKRRPHRRLSDRYVVYTHDPRHGYLLIALIGDPGAHALWTPAGKPLLANFETVADNFIFNGTVP